MCIYECVYKYVSIYFSIHLEYIKYTEYVPTPTCYIKINFKKLLLCRYTHFYITVIFTNLYGSS